MKVTSSAFEHNQPIPSKYTCAGENVNPPLEFSDIPDGTKSLVLIVDDPDAPGKTWVHWVLYNVSPNIAFIKENSTPSNAVIGMSDFGKNEYGGPCPPTGSHRYFFKLYALDTVLPMKNAPGKEEIEESMRGHVLGKAELIGVYELQKK